ncbi:CBS domain-containing protein [Pontibacter sp. Tf4]|uniref:CBS domain-containing protein n=1 Tax=Pontibacter sp. Tf4 TaxID=2761620 RepID=UPI001623196B|nr:CBS domain-containing protein [Pontibacter sp. Tf4]MBB6611830.1 CBS domain-containing protein [Pontibacter sp. Tf4]
MGTVRCILQKKQGDVISVSPDTTVYSALEKMEENHIGSLLVMDNGRFCGILTERDYARKVILKGKSSKETLVKEIMTAHPATVSPDTTMEQCMALMTSKYIRHLPVFDNYNLVGIVSIGDIVKYMIEEQQFIIEELEHYITGHQE